MGQWPPATGQWWNAREAGDPKTDLVTQGANSDLPGWQPKEKAPQLPQKRGTLVSAWVASVHKKGGGSKTPVYEGKGPKNPGVVAPLDAACCRGNCHYETGGRSHASARSVPSGLQVEDYLLPKALDEYVTKSHIPLSAQSSPSFLGNKQFLEVSRLQALSGLQERG